MSSYTKKTKLSFYITFHHMNKNKALFSPLKKLYLTEHYDFRHN